MDGTPVDQEPEEIVIAVMGATGAGKSSFINLLSQSNLKVGDELMSCTSKVQPSNVFELDGRPITLIDTPGFDDTEISDTDILKMISLYLSTTYQAGRKLNGLIYLQRISDVRMTGVSRRNFNMFRQLCGEETLKNVVIVTNMWCDVAPERGAAREEQLRTNAKLFKPVLDAGAVMLRHDGTPSSAYDIVRHIFKNSPQALRIQREVVDENKAITETAAGIELERDLIAVREKCNQQLSEIRQEMKDALAARDAQAVKELQEVRAELEARIERLENDRSRLSREFELERARANLRVRQLQEALEGRNILARPRRDSFWPSNGYFSGGKIFESEEKEDVQMHEVFGKKKKKGIFASICRAIARL